MASRRRLREAKEKTFRGNSGTDYRARYADFDWFFEEFTMVEETSCTSVVWCPHHG